MTISVELLHEDALALLRDLEKMHILKLVLPKKAEQPENEEPKFKAGFGGAKGMFVMADDFDEPLEDFKDYM
jgi:hypothetical protein